MTKKSQHVVPNPNGGWSVKSKGSTRATKSFDTQTDAIDWARVKSMKAGLDLVVHGRDGTVVSISSYGPVPHTAEEPKGANKN